VIGGMTLASALGILMVPVTFAVVEYLSHRFTRGGKDLTMDSTHVQDVEPELTPEVQGGRA
jgi:hydrophobic/amphiphilic exporter-1 (mainly G- bacteria), HAE1 family